MDFEPKSPSYMDASFTYDPLSGLDPYVQYPHSPFVGIQMGREYTHTLCPTLAYHASESVPGPSSASPRLNFNSLNLASNLTDYASYPTPAYTTTPSPARPFTPPDGAGISPAGLYSLSAGEMSSDGTQSGRRSRGSGTHSPASSQGVPYAATVPRSHRFNPIAAPPTRRAPKRKATRNDMDSDEDDDEFHPAVSTSAGPDSRRETIRKQRIESEQRRRDELREGYARLRETLPTSNQKASKVSLLDRGMSSPFKVPSFRSSDYP
jgi:Helix-loop-helix DNA-binding domain